MIRGLLFDLDGVLVDTAKYHFVAWKELADDLGISFTQQDNERLKGVSRMRSFEILLEIGGRTMSQEEKEACCTRKNEIYLEYIRRLTRNDLLDGAEAFLRETKENGYRIALGSASRNAGLILERLEIAGLFDAVIDGTKIQKAKPDPEVFLAGAKALGLPPEECVVFEDSTAGIEAAHRGGMKAIGIGSPAQLKEADLVYAGVGQCPIGVLKEL